MEALSHGDGIWNGRQAVFDGWSVLSRAMTSWGVRSREDLSEWIHRQGFPQPRWGGHFSVRAQEKILSIAAMTDSRVLLLQAMYVRLAMVACEQLPPPPPPQLPPPLAVLRQERPRRVAPETFSESAWSLLDDVNLTDMFQQRFSVLQSCQHHVRGRFIQANRKVLEAIHNAAMTNDPVMEERGSSSACCRCGCCAVLQVMLG